MSIGHPTTWEHLMSALVLFETDDHLNLLTEDASPEGIAVQANHHVIVHGGEAMVLDPGGHKTFNRVFAEISGLPQVQEIRYLFMSHQDPDIAAAANGWLMITDADALLPSVWTHFVAHFGVDKYLEERLKPIPDQGQWITLGGAKLALLPAHFLHSTGNFHVYDPMSKVLYTGDLGASIGVDYREVTDFDAHIPAMEGFHKRYMASNKALRAWAKMARTLEIDIIAPQHGALFRGRDFVERFISWAEELSCGLDIMMDDVVVPPDI